MEKRESGTNEKKKNQEREVGAEEKKNEKKSKLKNRERRNIRLNERDPRFRTLFDCVTFFGSIFSFNRVVSRENAPSFDFV
jgi:hypothetical protein